MGIILKTCLRKRLTGFSSICFIIVLIVTLLPLSAFAKEVKWVMAPTDYYDVYDFTDGVGVVRKNNKTGAVDDKGNLIVPFKYDYIYPFYNGLAIVTDYIKGNGLIDKTGREVIPCTNEYVLMPYMGRINSNGATSPEGLVSVTKDGKYGFFNTEGKLVTPLIYDFIAPSQEGLALAQKDGNYGFIDKTGAEVIPCIYKNALDFSEGLASVKLDNKYGFINKKGEMVLPCIYDDAASFTSSGLALVYSKDKGIQYIDKKGNIIIDKINFEGPYNDYNAYSFGKELALVLKRDSSGVHYGYMNRKGDISALIYEDPGFDIGLAKRDGKWGILNSNFEEFVPCIYDSISGFSDDLSAVTKDGKTGYIDRTGKLVIPCIYDAGYGFSEGLAFVRVNGKYGYIDKKGEMIIEPLFDRGSSFNGGVAWGYLNGKFGIIENPLKGITVPTITAAFISSRVMVDGEIISIDAYSISDATYFKLRDLAYLLHTKNSDKQFEIEWDSGIEAISIITTEDYTPVGGELEIEKGESLQAAIINSSPVYLDGERIELTSYTIKGNNYFKLRDIAFVINFDVDWEGVSNTIIIDYLCDYTPD